MIWKLLCAVALAILLHGCASLSVGQEYMKPDIQPVVIATPNGPTQKHWRIYQNPKDPDRMLVTESRGSIAAKGLNPFGLFMDVSAGGNQFDEALQKYLSLNRPGCEIARSTEVKDLYAYEYYLKCTPATRLQQ